MARTAMAMTIVATLGFLVSSVGSATEVYWTPAHDLAPQGILSSITWGDLDADGDDDVVRGGDFVCWNTGGCPGPPVWQVEVGVVPPLSNCSYRQTTLGDLDADGDLDLVYGCFQPQLHMFWNTGTPQMPAWHYDPAAFDSIEGASYAAPHLGDLDADGDLDLIISSGSHVAALFENAGTPQTPIWTPGQVLGGVYLNGSNAVVALADLDGDSDLDMVGLTVSTPPQSWENTGGPGQWQFTENPAMLTGVDPPSGQWWGLALPDVDCDGDPDLLAIVYVQGGTQQLLWLNESAVAVRAASWTTIKALYR